MHVPRGSGVAPRCGAAVTPAPSRRDAAPTGSLRDVHGTQRLIDDVINRVCTEHPLGPHEQGVGIGFTDALLDLG